MADGSITDEELAELIRRTEDASSAYMRGDMDRYLALTRHARGYTLMNPLGGAPARYEDRTESVKASASYFKAGDAKLEFVQAHVWGDTVILVMVERQHGQVGGLPDQDWSLRVTLVYRRDGSDWQVVHRHADPLVHAIDLEQAAALARGGPLFRSTLSAALPEIAIPPVAGELGRQIHRLSDLKDVDRAVVVLGANDARRRERRRRPAPYLPAERRVKRRANVGRPQRTHVIGTANDALERLHERRAVTPPPAIGAHAHALDIARPQRPSAVQQPPLNDSRMPNQLATLPHKGMHSAQRVLPVVIRHLAFEHPVEERARCSECRGSEVGGMSGADFDHWAMVARSGHAERA